MKFPMLTRFTFIIRSITPSQTENEIDFSLVGIYTVSLQPNLSVEMISGLIFINRSIADLGCNTTIDVFGGLLEAVADIVDEMESNPFFSADASDTE